MILWQVASALYIAQIQKPVSDKYPLQFIWRLLINYVVAFRKFCDIWNKIYIWQLSGKFYDSSQFS